MTFGYLVIFYDDSRRIRHVEDLGQVGIEPLLNKSHRFRQRRTNKVVRADLTGLNWVVWIGHQPRGHPFAGWRDRQRELEPYIQMLATYFGLGAG